MATAHKNVNADKMVEFYIKHLLENEKPPLSVYKFCKDNGLKEEDFYKNFGSFRSLEMKIWVMFFDNVFRVMEKSDGFDAMSSKDKLLTFYYTFFEVLAVNRSYILLVMPNEVKNPMKLMFLSDLRKKVVAFAEDLILEDNAKKTYKITKRPVKLFAEATWVQALFLLNFWRNDDSPAFEKTDLAIEKSVRVVFDVFDNTPIEGILDFGKFLFKEATV